MAGLQYRRRMPLGARCHVNVSRSGASVSAKVAKRVTVNSHGQVRVRLGRGLSWRL